MISNSILEKLDVDIETLVDLYTKDPFWKSLLQNEYGIKDEDLITRTVGDYLFDDLSIDTNLVPGKRPIGICVIGGLPGKGKFISLKNMSLADPENGTIETSYKNSGACMVWGPNGDKTYEKDAVLISTGRIPNSPKYFPAFQVCQRFNAGVPSLSGKWYLPDIDELRPLVKNKVLIDSKIRACGTNGISLSFNKIRERGLGDSIWSSRRGCGDDSAYTIDTYNGGTGSPRRNADYYGRRVRAFIEI